MNGNFTLCADVLLITVNKHETKAVHSVFGAGRNCDIVTKRGFAYIDYGEINGARVIHTISGMGSTDPGAMWDTTDRAVRAVRPWAIIAVGLAWGANEDKQHIGNIIVSQHLHLGGHKKIVEGDRRDRGPSPSASDVLKNLFVTTHHLYWPDSDISVEFGPLITEETLFDDRAAKSQALLQCPGALGGEMEASGLYGAARRTDTDWIVVKSICDWGYKKQNTNKEADQRTAAQHSAALVHAAISSIPFGKKRQAATVKMIAASDEDEEHIFADRLSPEATKLLVQASRDRIGRVLAVDRFDVLVLETNGRSDFVQGADPLIQARWDAALDELVHRDYLRAIGSHGEAFVVTKQGMEVAKLLTNARPSRKR